MCYTIYMLKQILELKYWEYKVFDNLLRDYFLFFLVSLCLMALFYLIKKLVLGRLKKIVISSRFDIDNTLLKAINKISPLFYFMFSLYVGGHYLSIHENVELVFKNVFLVVVVWQVIKFLNVFVDYFVNLGLEMKDDANSKTAIIASRLLIEILIWGLAIILLLDNFGINVTSLVAGLGISGIAVALAVQNILSDLFSSFSIYFDKPFVIGDLIRYGKITGTVEQIGLKTTRVRLIDGVLVVIANKDLTNTVVENLARRDDRRIDLLLTVDYQTPVESLRKIPDLLKEIIDKTENVKFIRSKLVALNDSSIDFSLIYKVNTSDFLMHVESRHEILLSILEEFEKQNIHIPYPTTRVLHKPAI